MKKLLLQILFFSLAASVYAENDSTEIRMNIKGGRIPGLAAVADVGGIKITAEEFQMSYEYGPAFVKREKDSQRRYLEFMVYEKLLAREGYLKKLDTARDLKEILADIKGDLATEELYRSEIWNRVKTEESEIEKGIAKSLITYNIRWIYKKSLSEITRHYSSLMQGAAFDSLFFAQLNETVTEDLRKMETTAFKLSRTNPALSSIIDSLKTGGISRPVKTPDGFYILRLDNIWKNMAVTETEYEKLQYDVSAVIFRDRADSLSDVYVQNIMRKESPVIERLSLNMIKAVLGRKLLSEEEYAKWEMLKNILPFEPSFNPDNPALWMSSSLVKMKSGKISLNDFFRWYRTREPYIKLSTKSHQSFFSSLEQIIWRMVRDRLLMREAERKGYEKSAEVIKQLKWWKDKLVFSKIKLEMASAIRTDSSALIEYYEKNRRRYLDDKGRQRPFEEVRGDVRNDLYSFEYTKKLVSSIMALKGKTKIKINSRVLENLPADIKDDPRAIDIYSVKKGGTFMRQAFPVIDYEWQHFY